MELCLDGITKRFPGGVVATDRVDLTIRGGEILALVGENGAGKSTLMNVLYGLYEADEGTITIDGEPLVLDSPSDAIEAGIGMVHQHFMLVPVFTVAENVVLGVEPTGRLGSLALAEARTRVRDLSVTYGLEVDPDARTGDLPVGLQQRVEIVKVLFRDARFLIFDEPTAVLTPQEVEEFFAIVETLREAGRAIVFITHKLREALGVADRIAVLRRGRIVGEADPAAVDERALAEMMVGRPVDLEVDKDDREPGEVVLAVEDLRVVGQGGRDVVDGVSFEVRQGEIVGIAGVQGNGQTELIEAIVGLLPVEGGSVRLAGRDLTDSSPRSIHRAGVAHIPENRQEQGLILDFTLTENAVLDSYYDDHFSHRLTLDWAAARRTAERLIDDYDIRAAGADATAGSLSGGNQQKLVVAREVDRDVALTIAVQPTRGIDVGSIENIHRRLVAERDDGGAILLVSTELDEILALADRILVVFRGRLVAERAGGTATSTELGLLMAGLDPDEKASEAEATTLEATS